MTQGNLPQPRFPIKKWISRLAIGGIIAALLAFLALLPEPKLCDFSKRLGSELLCPYPTLTPTQSPPATRTPGPTPTPILPGMILLDEDFSNRNSLKVEPNDGRWEIQVAEQGNMVYEIDNRNNTTGHAFGFPLWNWGDYSITYRFRVFEGTTKPFLAVGFRMQDYAPNKCCVEYILNFEGTMGLIRLLISDVSPEWVPIQDKPFELVLDKWYSVRIQAAHDLIEIYVDGQLYLKVNDTRHDQGAISWSIDPGNHVQFDDIRVTAIEG